MAVNGMAATLVRLRWALTVNQWRRSPFTLVMSIIGALYILGAAVFLVVGLTVGLPGEDVAFRGVLTALATSVVVLLWLVLPPLVTGVDATLDPRSFLVYPVPVGTLLRGLLLSAFTTPVGIATLIVTLGVAASWRDQPAALAFGVVGAVISTVTAVSLGYGVTGMISAYAGRRRVRETVSVLLMIPLMLGGIAFAQAAESFDTLMAGAPPVAEAASWTPFGAGAAAAWAAAEGRWGLAAVRLAVALLWCALALALWHLAVRRTVRPVGVGGGPAREAKAAAADPRPLRWLGRPATGPRTAIAARAQHYWFTDPRYMAGLITIPLMAVLLWFTGSIGEDGAGPAVFLAMAPITAWALAYSLSADIAYDHTAFHLHVVAGVKGIDDRIGRLMGMLGWGVPLVVVVAVATCAAAGDWGALPAVLGLSLGLLGSVCGLAALVSARWVYPVPKPGDSPFQQPQGAMVRTMVVQFGALLASAAMALPMLVPAIVFSVTREPVWSWVALAVGLAWGALLLWLGVRLGARWYDRAQAETFQAVKAF